jgi:ribonuclease T1
MQVVARFVTAIVGAALALTFAPAGFGRTTPDALPTVALADLPKEASAVNAAVRAGGPFRYDRDGVVFNNREKLLPIEARGHYHEYTVPTPGVKGRGARRIVCGGAKTAPDACWYTDDHYRSFRRIRE